MNAKNAPREAPARPVDEGPITEPPNEEQRAAIERWCDAALAAYGKSTRAEQAVGLAYCGYSEGLPSRSVRSTVLWLLASVRETERQRDEAQHIAGAARAFISLSQQLDASEARDAAFAELERLCS